jgi:hypothetical protein
LSKGKRAGVALPHIQIARQNYIDIVLLASCVIILITMRNFVLLAIVCIGLVLAGLSAGCSSGTAGSGILEGNVTIGPICPVEHPGTPCPVPCELYQARKVLIYNSSETKLIAEADIDCTGNYSTELKPGMYTIDITRDSFGHVSSVPQKIEIKEGQTVELNIDIDTGIR